MTLPVNVYCLSLLLFSVIANRLAHATRAIGGSKSETDDLITSWRRNSDTVRKRRNGLLGDQFSSNVYEDIFDRESEWKEDRKLRLCKLGLPYNLVTSLSLCQKLIEQQISR